MPSSEIFRAPLSGVATAFSEWVRMDQTAGCALQIVHPTGPTTTYSIEATDNTEQDIANNVQSVINYTTVTIPVQSAAATVGVELSDFQHGAFRVKLVNSAGAGTPVVRARKWTLGG